MPGVTASQIRIVVLLLDAGGATTNSALGLPSPQQQQADFQALIDSINTSGGLWCRQLAPDYQSVNPGDPSALQSECNNVAQIRPFAVLDAGDYTVALPLVTCYTRRHIPFFGLEPLTVTMAAQNYPYLFGTYTIDEMLYNTVFSLHDRGYLNAANGFRKLGYLYADCYPQLATEEENWLRQVGLSTSQIVPFDVGCPTTSFASPSVLEQAVLKFQQEGVTHMTADDSIDFTNFTHIAEQQGFKPKYGLPDISEFYVNSSVQPDPNNLAGAVAVTNGRSGEPTTPDLHPSSGTSRCDGFLHGQPSVYQQYLGGQICNEVWMFAAAVGHAPSLSQPALASGLEASRSVDFSYPEGPTDLSTQGVTFGGQYWRTISFIGSCTCWQVADPTFHHSYPGVPHG